MTSRNVAVPGQGWNRTREGETPPRCSSKSATVRYRETGAEPVTDVEVDGIPVAMSAPWGDRIALPRLSQVADTRTRQSARDALCLSRPSNPLVPPGKISQARDGVDTHPIEDSQVQIGHRPSLEIDMTPGCQSSPSRSAQMRV